MIRGEGLVLRPPVPEDAPRALELYRDPDQLAFGMPVGVTVPGSVEEVERRAVAAREAWDALEPCELTVDDGSGRYLGSISWRRDVPALLRVADVGYSVHPDARGQGVAGRALRVLAHWLTAEVSGPRQARVQLDHSVENPASCRTAERAGFAQEGVRRAFLPLRDDTTPDGLRRHDVCLHGFVPDRVLPPR